MLYASFFDLSDQVARAVRKNTKPFGGIQLVLTGDLLQSKAWSESISECIVLTEVFRQSNFEFVVFLTCIRLGAINDKVTSFIEKLEKPKQYDSDSGPVNLYSTKAGTDAHNNTTIAQ